MVKLHVFGNNSKIVNNIRNLMGEKMISIARSNYPEIPLKLLGKMEPNLTGSIYVRSSIKLLHLVPFGQQTWPPRLIIFSDWLMLKKSSPLKQLGQMEPNLAGSIYVRSKPGIDGPWVCPFQNCVRQPHPPFKMAAVF